MRKKTKAEAHYGQTYSYWESRARRYLEEPKQKVLGKVASILRKKGAAKVLDVGSGPAHYAIRLVRALGCQITCLDFSEKMLTKARENVKKEGLVAAFSFIRGNILNIKLQADSFDAITIISVLHYLLPADIEAALRKSYAALQGGGKIIVVEYWASEKLTETEKFTLQIAEQNRASQGVKATFLKEDDYRHLLENVGFENVRVGYVRERIYLDKYFEMNPEMRSVCEKHGSIRVAIFEATK